jgi:hypothetical protein
MKMDELDGSHQVLSRPSLEMIADQNRDLPNLPTNLVIEEQDRILKQVTDRLSQCAFDFVAIYEFPILIDCNKKLVEKLQDRESTEWIYLLKRLAFKRHLPARVLYNRQIKQLVTILENSLLTPDPARYLQPRLLRDDKKS